MALAPHADPFSSDGVVDSSGRKIGVLLSHGFTGSPASMVPWGQYLAEQGYAVSVLKYLVKSMPAIGDDIKKPGVSEYAYDRTPLKALHSMVRGWKQVRADLPKVTAPLLLIRASGDHVVDPSSARIILGNVSSRDVTETVLENSYHVATIDNDAPQIFEESAAFIRRVTAP